VFSVISVVRKWGQNLWRSTYKGPASDEAGRNAWRSIRPRWKELSTGLQYHLFLWRLARRRFFRRCVRTFFRCFFLSDKESRLLSNGHLLPRTIHGSTRIIL